MSNEQIHIIGAGPAGLVAAINLARNDYSVTVYEMKEDVGTRFNGDFQGIENWSSDEDALAFLATIGISVNFRCTPYNNGVFFNPDEEQNVLNTSRPFFYLVERGTNAWSLDQGLRQQAIDAGVVFKWNQRVTHAPAGKVIISTGPRAADAIAKGIVFSTSHEDYYAGFLGDNIAPKGYAYLLVNQGKATFATCLFEDFKSSSIIFEAALERMKKNIKIDIKEPKNFGGYVNFSLNETLVKKNRIYYVGESAGFQDILFGFGMRYAMHSGYLAAKSIIEGISYPELCHKHIIPKMKTSLVNRWLFNRLHDTGYSLMLNKLKRKADVIPLLKSQYNPSWYKTTLLPVAKKTFKNRLEDKQCMHLDCSCVWCKHGEHTYSEVEC